MKGMSEDTPPEAPAPARVRLDIISDPICPWCYIGRTALGRALAAQPDHPFQIAWHPYQLNPDMPAEGMERTTYLEAKFGGRAAAAQAYAPVLERAEAEGLNIDFPAIVRTPNTMNAHRLIEWAGAEGRQDAVAMALFRAYFDEGRDIGDIAVLADVAEWAGLDRAMILRLLQGDAERDAIAAQDRAFRDMGITGVPTFIVAGQHVVTGAQPTQFWAQVIDEVVAQARAATEGPRAED